MQHIKTRLIAQVQYFEIIISADRAFFSDHFAYFDIVLASKLAELDGPQWSVVPTNANTAVLRKRLLKLPTQMENLHLLCTDVNT